MLPQVTFADRHIPHRLDPSAAERLAQVSSSSSSTPQTPQQTLYASRLYKACHGTSQAPRTILPYQSKPTPLVTMSQQYINNLAQSDKENRGLSQTPPRKITLQKIFEAPDIVDNFYSSVTDVSQNNTLVLALNNKAFAKRDATVEEIDDAMQSDSPLTMVHCQKQSDYVLLAREDGAFSCVDQAHHKAIFTNKLPSGYFETAVSNEPHTVYWSTSKGHILQTDVRSLDTQIVGSHHGHACGLSLHANNQAIASGGNDNAIKIWDLRRPQPALHEIHIHEAAVRALAWAPFDSKLLVSGGGTQDKKICITSFKTGMPEVSHKIHTDSQVTQIRMSPHSGEFVSSHGFSSHSCQVWHIANEALTKIADVEGHKGRVIDTALSPDASTLYTASADETVRVWSGVFGQPPKKPTPAYSVFMQIR